MGALILLALLTTTLSLRSQEVTYNTTPTHQLGPQLWQLPIGGQLTMSRDGKTLLVASMADTCFYVVDVESGSVRRRLSAQYWVQTSGGFTSYSADNDLGWLGVSSLRFNVDPVQEDLVLIDLDSGDTIALIRSKVRVIAVSRKHDRMLHGSVLARATTLDTIKTFAEEAYTTGWFDDDRGLLYRCVPNAVQEIDVVTGMILRSWGTNARTFSRAIRPQQSMWLYVFAWPETDKPESTFVDAIHLETGERVHYTHEYAGGGPVANEVDESSYVYSTSSEGLMSSIASLGYNYLCSFDASKRLSQAVVSPSFLWGSGTIAKENAVDPTLTRYLHTWPLEAVDRDSCILRCNAMSPVSSSGSDDTGAEPHLRIQMASGMLIIVEPRGQPIHSIDIISTDGRILQHHTGEELDHQPRQVNIAGLPSGSYICALEGAFGFLTTHFFIYR